MAYDIPKGHKLLRKFLQNIIGNMASTNETNRETPIFERTEYTIVFDDDAMSILMIPGQNVECIVSFTGVGHALGGIDLQNPEFSRSNSHETKIFIIDKQRSWGNNIDWKKLTEVLLPLTRGARITTLGNSMGGFLAILSAPLLGAEYTIAFAPQWSIDPKIVPDERRWLHYTSRIPRIHYRDLSVAINAPSKFYVFFGDSPDDIEHLSFFRKMEHIDLVVVEGCGHDVANFLKNRNQLYSAINICRNGGDVRSTFKKQNIRTTGP